MLQEIKITNYLSFRDEVELSFEATKDTTFEEAHVVEVAPGVRLLRFAMIMGANASGKSNLLYALEFLRRFWFERKQEVGEPTGCTPFLLDNDTIKKPSKFEIRFWTKGVKYWYVLTLDAACVHDEKLYYYKMGSAQPTLIVKRQLDDAGHSVLSFNTAAVKISTAAQEEIQLKCLNNMSLFAARNQVNLSLPIFDDARDWMRTGLLPLIEPGTQMFNYAKQRLHDDAALKQYMLDFVHQADFNITDVQSDDEKERTSNTLNMQFIHTVRNGRGQEHYAMPAEMQSLGTKRTLGLETTIYEAVRTGALLNVDEFDASLHPDLLEFTIQRFLQEKSESQMIISTHYDPLLATIDDLIRKDCVWFTEKGEDGASKLYSLTDFKGLGKMSSTSIRNAYRHGLFGALPNI
jgi:AAA15 family ATPase/GTPase